MTSNKETIFHKRFQQKALMIVLLLGVGFLCQWETNADTVSHFASASTSSNTSTLCASSDSFDFLDESNRQENAVNPQSLIQPSASVRLLPKNNESFYRFINEKNKHFLFLKTAKYTFASIFTLLKSEGYYLFTLCRIRI